MSIMGGITPTGTYRPFRVDDDGRLVTSGTSTGGGGGGTPTAGGATEETLLAVRDRLPSMLTGGRLGVSVQDGLLVRIVDEVGGVFSTTNPLPVEFVGNGGGSTEATLLEIRNRLPTTLLGGALRVTLNEQVETRLFDEAGVIFSDSNPLPVTVVNTSSGQASEATLLQVRNRLPSTLTNDKLNVFIPDDVDVRLLDEAGAAFTETNPMFVQVVGTAGTTDTELPAAANLADSQAESPVPTVGSRLQAFNGTNWSRIRSGLSGTLPALTGVLNTLLAATYSETYTDLTNNQHATLRTSQQGKLLVDTHRFITTTIAQLSPTYNTTATSGAVTVRSNRVSVRFKIAGGALSDARVEVQINSHPTDTTDYVKVAEQTVNGNATIQFDLGDRYVNTLRVAVTKEGNAAVSTVDTTVIYGV